MRISVTSSAENYAYIILHGIMICIISSVPTTVVEQNTC